MTDGWVSLSLAVRSFCGLGERSSIASQRFRALLVVVHDRLWVAGGPTAGTSPWLVNFGRWQVAQFGHESADVGAVRVEFLALRDGIEDPEVRCRVGAGSGGPLPAVLIAGEITVDQL